MKSTRVIGMSLAAGLLGGSLLYVSHALAQDPQAPPPQQQPKPPQDQSSQQPPDQQPQQRGEIDPKADQLLRKMSTDLAAMKTFQVDSTNATEVVTKEGQKLQMLARSTVTVQRPNKLRTDRNGLLADVAFFYDGKNVTIYGKRANLYATAKAPPNLDDAIDFTRNELGIDAPAADLLYTDPYKILMEDAVSGTYIGEEPVGDRTCHHLAYRGNETDWQIWIEDGPRALPCRFVITSKKVEGSPEYSVQLDNWKVDPQVDPQTFTFAPPKDAKKIDFLAVKQKKQELQQQQQPQPQQPQRPRS